MEVKVEEEDGLEEDTEAVNDETEGRDYEQEEDDEQDDDLDGGNKIVYREYSVLEYKVSWKEEDLVSRLRNQLQEKRISQIYASKEDIPR